MVIEAIENFSIGGLSYGKGERLGIEDDAARDVIARGWAKRAEIGHAPAQRVSTPVESILVEFLPVPPRSNITGFTGNTSYAPGERAVFAAPIAQELIARGRAKAVPVKAPPGPPADKMLSPSEVSRKGH